MVVWVYERSLIQICRIQYCESKNEARNKVNKMLEKNFGQVLHLTAAKIQCLLLLLFAFIMKSILGFLDR